MKKIFVFLVVTLIWTACGNSKESSETTVPIALLQDGVEVLSFHSKQRCPTCIAIENETRNLLNSSFEQEMADSTIVLRVFDLSEKENQQIAEHYQVSFSSLILSRLSVPSILLRLYHYSLCQAKCTLCPSPYG